MVDTILAQTAIVNKDDKMEEGEATDAWSAEQASKIILTGQVVTTVELQWLEHLWDHEN